MLDTAFRVPLVWCEVVPVIHVLVHEFGLCVVNTVQTQPIKVLLDLYDCASDHIDPFFVTIGALVVRFKQTEVFFEGLKVLADLVDGFAALLVDWISTSLHKCLEVLEDSLCLAGTRGTHLFAHRLPEPSSQHDSEMASSRVEHICNLVSCRYEFGYCRTYG